MSKQHIYRFSSSIAVIIFILVSAACGMIPATPNAAPTASASPVVASASPSPQSTESTPTTAPAIPISGSDASKGILYQDKFTDPSTGWPEDKFDNYFIGYHEPEYYHIAITSPNYKTTVFAPGKKSYTDATIELQVFAVSAKTAATGDFRYGLAFRRSGDQYYAFTISPRTKTWYVLKNSPNELTVLAQGTENSIQGLDTADTLRVDAQGPNFFFHINDKLVGQTTDSDYAKGEVGFYVETLDAANVHIHFDTLTIRNLEVPLTQGAQAAVLYQDDFTNPASGWAEKKFDNYFIGYHEPEYYHIAINSPNYKTTVFEPEKKSYTDATIELQVFAVSAKTAATGDFRYGLAFRRSGDQYYAFTVSPRTKTWYVLKSSPSKTTVLAQGTEDSIQGLDTADTLRVDAQGPNFLFHINDKLVGQTTDSDYANGEIGFYVETLDATNVHIHFDKLTIEELSLTLTCNINGGTVYVRSGPGKTYSQIAVLSDGDVVQALGKSPNLWIKINMKGSDTPGWVSYSEGYMSCTPTVDLFPTVSP